MTLVIAWLTTLMLSTSIHVNAILILLIPHILVFI